MDLVELNQKTQTTFINQNTAKEDISELTMTLKPNFTLEITFKKDFELFGLHIECEQAQEMFLLFKDYKKINSFISKISDKI